MKNTRILGVIVLLAMLVVVSIYVSADPTGTQITFNSTVQANASTPGNRTDAGGTITTLTLTATQQNSKWKAYVGNISGSLTLDDTALNTIYSWGLPDSTITGEIFASRSSAVTWSLINCSTIGIIGSEETALGLTSTDPDSIRNTFNDTTHPAFSVAGRGIPANLCNATATFVNDTKQAMSGAYFPSMLLDDDTNLIYSTKIRRDTAGYDQRIFDFQMILADDPTVTSTTYYFYAELGS